MNWQWRDNNITFGIRARFFYTKKRYLVPWWEVPASVREKERFSAGGKRLDSDQRFNAQAANQLR
jgi:hypothetical protein